MSAPRALPQIVTASPGPASFAQPRADRRGAAFPQPPPRPPARGAAVLSDYFDVLFAAYGPQHWWPGRSRFEIIVGAILTQNTSWRNVERALANLRDAKLLSPPAIRDVSRARLASCLRPSGYFRQKSKALKTFVAFLFSSCGGSLRRLFSTPTETLRRQLLALRGIGPETADSILLYAGKHPVFVVDAYARRILERHGLAQPKTTYEQLREMFESVLPREHQLFNEFHALFVRTGKDHCHKTNPVCRSCPLAAHLPQPGGTPPPAIKPL